MKKIIFLLIVFLVSFGVFRLTKAVESNLIPNPSMEQADSTGNKPQSWLSNKWGINSAAFNYLNSGHSGNRSVQVTMTSYTNGDAKWYFSPQNVTANSNYQFNNWYQANVPTEIDLAYQDSSGKWYYNYLATLPAAATFSETNLIFQMPASAVKATIFHLIEKVGYLITDDYYLGLQGVAPSPSPSTTISPTPTPTLTITPTPTPTITNNPNFSRGLVSLTFDDGYLSFYQNGLPLINKYNMKSTEYIELFDIANGGYMTLNQIKNLYNQGHEIASHTVHHPHLPELTIEEIDQELADSKAYLEANVGPVYNFATPYGEYNDTVKNEIRKYYRSHRSTDDGYNTKANFDIYNIQVQNILKSTTQSQVQNWVNYAKQNKAWLVLVYHEVKRYGDTYSITPAKLDAQLNYIYNSGLTVLTVNQALNELVPQLQ